MKITSFPLRPPSLQEIATVIRPALHKNYKEASVEVVECPDLQKKPFGLAAAGLGGKNFVADIGGQPNLFPRPLLDKRYSLLDIASAHVPEGVLLGAGAGPFHEIGQNSELAPNLSWTRDQQGKVSARNLTRYTEVQKSDDSQAVKIACKSTASTDCALMCNIYVSEGRIAPVLRIKARGRRGSLASLTDVIRFSLRDHFGDGRCVSLGGAFLIREGKANFHVMPDFPSEDQLPFASPKVLNDWLTYHDFQVENTEDDRHSIVCLSVLHSADPEKKMGLRMEHTHCFTTDGSDRGGHYHGDIEGQDIEYEGYFNVAQEILRVDRPETTLDRDLHD